MPDFQRLTKLIVKHALVDLHQGVIADSAQGSVSFLTIFADYKVPFSRCPRKRCQSAPSRQAVGTDGFSQSSAGGGRNEEVVACSLFVHGSVFGARHSLSGSCNREQATGSVFLVDLGGRGGG